MNRVNGVADGIGTITLVKSGTNLWEVYGTSTYTGATQINDGTLQIGNDDALPVATAVRVGTGTTAGTFDLNGFNQTIGSLLVQTNSNAVTNNILVDSGKTLTVNGAVTIGVNADNSDTNLTASGGGSMVVNSGGASFQIGGATGATNENRVDVDFSGLSSFTSNLGAGSFRLGDSNSSSGTSGLSTLKLATNNTITAASIRIGDGSGPSDTHLLTLGSGTNVFNTNSLNIGSAGAGIRSGGSVLFDGADTTGQFTLRASDGTSRAILNMVNTTGNTAGNMDAIMNLGGHTADILASTVTLASRSLGTGAATATLSFDQGTLDVTTLSMASRTSTGTGGATAVVNLGDSAALGTPTVTIGTINMAVNTSSGGTVEADLNITGGNVTIGTGSGTAINMANAGTGRTVTSDINITGGTVEVTGNIARTGGVGTENATVTVNGGTLDLNGNSIGGGSAQITLAAQSGTLSNLGQLNGGGTLTKTTAGVLVLEGANTYTGKTVIDAGKLSISDETNLGTNPGASTADQLTLNGGTLLTTADLTLDDSNRGITVSAASSIETSAGTAATIGSTIMGSASVSKEGTGTLIFTTAQSGYSGDLTVNAGTLLANNTSGSATGTGSVTVAATGTLGGTGIIAPASNNSITINGLLSPGTTGATAGSDMALTASGTGNISLSTVTFDIFANTVGTNPLASNDRVLISATDWSNILFSGSKTLNVSTTLDSTTWISGDNWQLFDWSGIAGGTAPTIGSGGFDVFNLPTLNSGLAWDTSALYTTGIITIAPEPTRALLLLLGLFGLAMRRRRK